MKINKITPAYCQSIINEWRSEYKNFSNFISLASKVFEFAVMLKQIEKNPLDAVKRPSQDKTPTKETPFFSKEELESFMKTLVNYDIHYQAMIRLIAYTGMQKNDCQNWYKQKNKANCGSHLCLLKQSSLTESKICKHSIHPFMVFRLNQRITKKLN